MNRAIPDEIVEEIRSRVNIVDLLGSYVHLKRGGNGVYKALCPFHQEKTPSFTVNENRQSYHCFGCGKGGDVFRFFMEREMWTLSMPRRYLPHAAGSSFQKRSTIRSSARGRANRNVCSP